MFFYFLQRTCRKFSPLFMPSFLILPAAIIQKKEVNQVNLGRGQKAMSHITKKCDNKLVSLRVTKSDNQLVSIGEWQWAVANEKQWS